MWYYLWFQGQATELQRFRCEIVAVLPSVVEFHAYVKANPSKLSKKDVKMFVKEIDANFDYNTFLVMFENGGGFAIVPWEAIDAYNNGREFDHKLTFQNGQYFAANCVTGLRYAVHRNRAEAYLYPHAMEAARQAAPPAAPPAPRAAPRAAPPAAPPAAQVQCGSPKCTLPAWHAGLCTGE